MSTERFKALEKQLRIIEELAVGFPRESSQYVALENAAFALTFAISEQYESFIHYIDSVGNELTEAQKENLRKMGISI